MHNYIFDFDGTLIDSSQEVLLCFQKAFEESNYKIDGSRLTSTIIGPPLKQIIKLIAPELSDETIIESVMKNFRKIYDYDEKDISKIYEGVYDSLCGLKREGKRLFIATFKPSIPTMRLIKKFNLNMFEDIYTVDKFEKHISKEEMVKDIIKKYNLKKAKTVMIGDALSDIMAGKNSGIKTIGALWGYEEDKTELRENADLCITLTQFNQLSEIFMTNDEIQPLKIAK